MKRLLKARLAVPLATFPGALALLPQAALAHPGHGVATGAEAGFLHPLMGADHILAMVAVGLLVLAFGLTAAMLVVFVDLLGVTIPVFPKMIQDPLTISFGLDTVVRVAYAAYAALAAALYVIFFTFAGKPRV